MYIITGGAGFIGSALIAYLNARGIEDIVVVDQVGTSSQWRNLLNKKYVQYWHKDEFLSYLKTDRVLSLLEGQALDGLIHLGACSTTTEKDFDYLFRNNVNYSIEVIKFALRHQVRLIHASSAATYGDGSLGYSDAEEQLSRLQPLNRYGHSKHLVDLWALRRSALSQIAVLKFFNVYGPNEYHKTGMLSGVYWAFHQAQANYCIRLFASNSPGLADGEQKRDFVYVKDCCAVMWWLLNNPHVNGVYNLGTGQARSWNELAQAVFAAMGMAPRIGYVDMPPELQSQYQNFTQAEMEKLKAAGYSEEIRSLEDGAADYIHNYLQPGNLYW